MKTKVFVLIIILSVFCNRIAKPQQNNFSSYSVEDGLPQSTVFSICNDSRGYLWLGTDGGGASKFDGIHFGNFNKKSGLSGNTVRTIIEDKQGNLWFGTDEGISVFDGYKFRTIDSASGLSKGVIVKLFCDAEGNIWAGTSGGGLDKIRLHGRGKPEIQVFSTRNGLSNDIVFDICEDRYKNIWIATLGGGINILQNQNNKSRIYCPRDILPSSLILSLKPDRSGNIWVGTYGAGAFIINSTDNLNKISAHTIKNLKLNDNIIYDILFDNEGRVWFATNNGGVNRFSSPVTGYFTSRTGLPDNQVVCEYQDKEGNIWFGTMGNGLCKFLGDKFAHYGPNDGISKNIFSIMTDSGDNLWVASNGNGLTRINFINGIPVCKNYSTKDGLNDNCIKSIAIDDRGNIWTGSSNHGISRFDGKSFTSFNKNDGLSDDNVNCVYFDSKGVLWCGTEGGISRFSGNEFFVINQSNYKLINNEVQTIVEDNKGNIWVGTLGGLVRLSHNIMTDFNEADGLTEKKIYSLAADKSGNIWIGTFGGGLFKFNSRSDSKKPIYLLADDGRLNSNNIYSLIFEKDNVLLVGTDKGLNRLILDNEGNIIKIYFYDKTNGFSGIENNLNAICKDRNNNFWFGTVKGITRFDPSREHISIKPPVVHITGVKLFFENTDWSKISHNITPWFNLPKDLTLSYASNHLTFNFIGISLKNPQKVLYRYMLEGLENKWSPPLPQNEVTFSGLMPGNYTFKVISCDENGNWTPVPETFSFTIIPPFWKTWWFYIIVILIIFFIFLVYIKYRERKLKREKAILECKVEERTKEIKEQKEIIEEKNRDIMGSIKYAQRIQEAILPSDKLIQQFFNDFFILYKPKDIVSGDFYWIEKQNEKVLYSAVDCTGHGVPGAFMSIIGHNGLNRSVKEYGLGVPSKILDKLNEIVEETLRQTENINVRDGMDIALCSFDKHSNILEYAGANNPLYIVGKRKELVESGKKNLVPNIEWGEFNLFEIKADSQPVGAFEYRKPFTNHVLHLEKGDTVYIFSDGFADQFGGPNGKKFKYKPFKELILSVVNLPLNEQKVLIDKTFMEWRGEVEQIDDVCIIGLRI